MSILVGVFGGCIVAGIFPWMAGELVVVGAAVLVPREFLPALVLVSAVGQMVGKTLVYSFARWAPQRLPESWRHLLDRASVFGKSRKAMSATVLSSATISLPPFFIATLACGTLGVPVRVFATFAFGGTVLRYAIVAWSAAFLGAGVT